MDAEQYDRCIERLEEKIYALENAVSRLTKEVNAYRTVCKDKPYLQDRVKRAMKP